MKSLKEQIDRADIREVAPMAGVTAVLVVAALTAGAVFVIYRRRRRLSFAQRFRK